MGNFNKFKRYLTQLSAKPDIIALSETKITTKVNQNPNVEISGYDFKYRKSTSFFGGVGFYISNQLDYSICEDLNIEKPECHCETFFIQLESKQKN